MNTINLYSLCSLLIVEDDLDDQMLLKTAFEQTTEYLSLHFARNAEEALDYLQQVPDHKLPDLIITDYYLPKQNGIKLIQHLNGLERYQKIKKVILSSSCYFPESDSKNYMPCKRMVKPHSYDGMMQLVEHILDWYCRNV